MPAPHVPLTAPPSEPQLTPEQILLGEPVEPSQRISLYDSAKFERFIKDWAFFFLQEISQKYGHVGHYGGSGDMGRDIVAHYPATGTSVVVPSDIFQCKHYDHPLLPSELWPEIGKLCYYTWHGDFSVPVAYYFMAPQDLGPEAGRCIEDPARLKAEFLTHLDKIPPAITSQMDSTQLAAFHDYIRAFDFSIFKTKPMHEVINEFRQTRHYAARFGGGLQLPPPPDPTPPATIAAHEVVYTTELLEAYRDHTTDPNLDHNGLVHHTELHSHFGRCRERFYCAESLREFSKASLPDTSGFHLVQDQVHDGVIDAVGMDYPSAYHRVIEVTRIAQAIAITNHPLRSYLKVKNLHGICHQLVNDGRFRWVR